MTVPARQRWLILAHAFNMDGRAASQTITDKLPHLRAAGIEVVVLSGVSGRHDAVVEHHQLWPAGPAGFRFELRHVLRRRFSHPAAYRFWMSLASLLLLPGLVIEKLLRPVESSWSWWISAWFKGRALARRQHFDLIYSTGGAFAAHLAGRALQRTLGLPWLAEVHDPFITPGVTPATPQQRMQARVEALICEHAQVAVWFTEQALASARARHPALGGRGRTLIPGIDAPFRDWPPYASGPVFVLGHFGSLSATRNLVPMLQALERLQASHPAVAAHTELHVYGGPLDPVTQAHLQASPVADRLRHFGRLEFDPATGLSGRERVLHRMRAADVLILLHGQEPICEEYIPSKLYEYLWMQRPILATVYRNPQMAAIVRDNGHTVVTLDDADEAQRAAALADGLLALHAQWQAVGLPDNGRRSPYTTEAAVRRLLGFVAELA